MRPGIEPRSPGPLGNTLPTMFSTRQDLTQGLFCGDLGNGKVGHKPRLVPCWTMKVIGSFVAMWTKIAFAKSPGAKPSDLAGHNFN